MARLRNAGRLLYFLVMNVVFAYAIEDSENQIPQYDVIVVGCGISGLAATARLVAGGARALCLEAEPRVGGRINTQEYGSGVAEFGAEWIEGRGGNVVYDLAQRYNIPIPTPPELGFEFYSSNGSNPDSDQCSQMSNYLFNEFLSISGSPDEPRQTIKAYISKKFEEYMDQKPDLQNENSFWNSFYAWFIETAAAYDAVDSYDVMSTKGIKDSVNCEGPPNFSWGLRGYWTLFDIILKKTESNPAGLPVDIKLDNEVVAINWLPDTPADVVSVQTSDGSRYTADTVIVTVSLGVLQHRYNDLFNPALPLAKQNGINLLDIGVANKVMLRYEEAFWKADKVIAFIWNEEDVAALSEDDKWLTKWVTLTPSEGSPNVLTFFLVGETAKTMESMPLEDLIPKVNFILEKFFKPHYPDLPNFEELRRSTWSSNPHFSGSYSYHGVRSDEEVDPTAALREPLLDAVSDRPRLLFAGEATHKQYYATVNGAIRSGWREADRVLGWRYRHKQN